MSGEGLVEVLRRHLPYDQWDGMAWANHGMVCACGEVSSDQKWYPTHLADVVTAHLAARLEGCREEVAEAVYRGVVIDDAESERDVADAALVVVREALGLPQETQGAALSASDGADGPEGHRDISRAGDGL